MTNIEYIEKYQTLQNVHPLTCGNKSSHALLKPIIEDNKIVLVCLDCDYRQIVEPYLMGLIVEGVNLFGENKPWNL